MITHPARESLERAISSTAPVLSLREAAAEMLAAGIDRAALLAQFEELRAALTAEGRERDADVVLDVMDFVDVWCAPHMAL